MLSFSPNQAQLNMFKNTIIQFVNDQHPLIQLADIIPWNNLEKDLAKHYSHTGAPAKPIRLMIGLLLLKQLYDLGDETIIEDWKRDPYFQYFTGEADFQWNQPCDPSDLVHFRKRIGKEGMELILKMSIELVKNQKKKKGKKVKFDQVILDTTVQEKNVTYPTDFKLYNKVIKKVWKISQQEGIKLRQSYSRTVKKLSNAYRFSKSKVKKVRLQATRAQKKTKTIAGRLLRDLNRKLSPKLQERYSEFLQLSDQLLKQKRSDKNKVYSLHAPEVSCISKGKTGKKYEFGSKVSVVISKDDNVVLGVVNFNGNPHDSQTLLSSLEQVERLTGARPKEAIVDRGYRGKHQVGGTSIIYPGKKDLLSKHNEAYYKRRFKRRSAVEGVISHMKRQYGLCRNYLQGELGDQLNALLSGIAFNLQSCLRGMALKGKYIFVSIIKRTLSRLSQLLCLVDTNPFYLYLTS